MPDGHRRFGARLLAGLFLLTVLMQYGLSCLDPAGVRALSGDEKRYIAVARSWSAGEPVELDPLWPPGYPVFLSSVFAAAGEAGALFWIMSLQAAAILAAGMALAGIARMAGASEGIAALAGAILVVDPQVASFSRLFWPEAIHLALLLSALGLVIALNAGRFDRPNAAQPSGFLRSRLPWIALGLLLGCAIATKSLLLPFIPLLLLILLAVDGRKLGVRERLARATCLLLPLLAVLAPVSRFEHARSGSWSPGGSARFNLWVGLTDVSPRSLRDDRAFAEYLKYRDGGATFAERQRAITLRLRELVAERGWPAILAGQFPRQYQRLFDRESYFSAMLPPDGSRVVAGEGFAQAPPALARLLGGFETGLYATVLFLAPLGLWRMLRTRRTGARWIAGLLAGQLVLFYFLHVKSRYRLTLMPLLILGAVWTVAELCRGRDAGTPPPAGLEIGLSASFGALLLYLAFAPA
ncbi:MAG: hypothetical protein ABI639_02135 [Thermoanaerobaculia bacterium]